jgi:hypothetical protein
MRKAMRPVSLKRIVEVASLALDNSEIDIDFISEKLGTTKNRSREMLRELKSLNLLENEDNRYYPNKNTENLILFVSEEKWSDLNELFINNSLFYKELLNQMGKFEKGYSIENLLENLSNSELHYNRAILEVLLKWGERFSVIQRNLYERKYYLIKKSSIDENSFEKSLFDNYKKLNKRSGLFLTKTYVEIPLLREKVCEELKITRLDFDKYFHEAYRKSIGKIELAGAPTITAAKKSPLSIKETHVSKENGIITTISEIETERKGITIFGKSYYFLAIH